ncbi:non-homologous end joining protein Ku [Alkalicoccobacillus plakortidis]|uniref:Non-homologous end joining protein Ku n=1 Tax=Alkalicoccobacillus plakortidis TaxID=444060 RepID=A0ABT0XMV6_9BACI|nr:Ku protein [Alkalicoccobacillus plakortidis]MCM2676574.1 Ku protein [Alkalicoccobacillus plakortidis]
MHTVWKGSISFGLVSIPVKLHTATENKDIKLRQLHKKCHTPISYQKQCPNCEQEVKQEDIVKAYEYSKNKFVVLDEEDLQELKKENEDKAVEILDFVKLEEIDPIYFERSYFLAPGDGGNKAYSLLHKALEQSGKIGVAKIIIRSKEQLAIVRVYQQSLLMETIHFPDEVRKVEDVPSLPEEKDVDEKQLKTALLLIDQLTTTFDPASYHDEYREDLMKLIEKKQSGEETVTASTKKQTSTNVTDLTEALQLSLERTKPKRKAAVKRKTTSRKKA